MVLLTQRWVRILPQIQDESSTSMMKTSLKVVVVIVIVVVVAVAVAAVVIEKVWVVLSSLTKRNLVNIERNY